MKRGIYFFFILMLLISNIFFLSCNLLSGANNKVTVAIMTNLNKASEIGESEVLMSKLYLKLNPNTKIKIEYFNDGWDKELVNNALDKIISKKIKFLITSHTSTVANVIFDRINSNKILTFVLGATTTNLSGKDDYHIRLINDVKNEQYQIAGYINKLEGNKLILFIDTYNKGYTLIAKDFFKTKISKNIIKEIYFDATNFDILNIEQSIANDIFDIVYFIVGSKLIQIGSIAQLLYYKNNRCKIVYTPWVMNESLLKIMGPAYKNSIFSSFLPSPSENKNLEFIKNSFFYEYNFYPTNISYKIYEALEVLDYSFKNEKTTPEDIKKLLLDGKKVKTYFETIKLDNFGDFHSELFFFNNLSTFYH